MQRGQYIFCGFFVWQNFIVKFHFFFDNELFLILSQLCSGTKFLFLSIFVIFLTFLGQNCIFLCWQRWNFFKSSPADCGHPRGAPAGFYMQLARFFFCIFASICVFLNVFVSHFLRVTYLKWNWDVLLEKGFLWEGPKKNRPKRALLAMHIQVQKNTT